GQGSTSAVVFLVHMFVFSLQLVFSPLRLFFTWSDGLRLVAYALFLIARNCKGPSSNPVPRKGWMSSIRRGHEGDVQKRTFENRFSRTNEKNIGGRVVFAFRILALRFSATREKETKRVDKQKEET